MDGLEQALQFFGGLNPMARALRLRGYRTIQTWRRLGRVPAKYCPRIEDLAGVPCEALNPDVDWGIVRRNAGRFPSEPSTEPVCMSSPDSNTSGRRRQCTKPAKGREDVTE